MPTHQLGRKHQAAPARCATAAAHATTPSTLIAATARTDSTITGRARQDRRRHRHRRQHQDRERVLQPARQIEQDRELQRVVAEAERGVTLAEPRATWRWTISTTLSTTERRRRPAPADQRQMKPEPVMDGQQRQRLAGDRDPADRHQRAQADPARFGVGIAHGGKRGIGHDRIPSGGACPVFVRFGRRAGGACQPDAGRWQPDAPYRGDARARHRSRQPGQTLSGRDRGRRDQL